MVLRGFVGGTAAEKKALRASYNGPSRLGDERAQTRHPQLWWSRNNC